jgi:hypothetical protein
MICNHGLVLCCKAVLCGLSGVEFSLYFFEYDSVSVFRVRRRRRRRRRGGGGDKVPTKSGPQPTNKDLPVVSYGCETWSVTLRKEHRLKMFENRALENIQI